MGFARMMTTTVAVRRAGSTAVVATIPARILPLSPGDQATAAVGGALEHDFRGFTPIADVRITDVITDTVTGLKYEVRGARDAAGAGHHLELDLRKVI